MTRSVQAGQHLAFEAHLDVQRFSDHEGQGNTIDRLRQNFTVAFESVGSVRGIRVEAFRNPIFADTLSIGVSMQVSDPFDSAHASALILAAANRNRGTAEEMRPEVTALRAAWFGRAGIRGIGAMGQIVDESTWTVTTIARPVPAPTASSSTTGAAVASVATTVVSENPVRNERTPLGAAVTERTQDLGFPSWIGWVAFGAACLVGVVAIGYGARGIAQVARET